MGKQSITISEPSGTIGTTPPSRFSRAELLLTILLAIALVGCAGPALQKAQSKARQNKALQSAKMISKALHVYADENDGLYPTGDDANQAFAKLYPDIGQESLFYVQGSAWHGRGRFANGPDELWGGDAGGEALEPGENHWAFNIAANGESTPTIPLIADGFSHRVGTYSTDPTEVGGVWGGRSAIVVFCDFSGKVVRLDENQKFTNPKASNRDEFARYGVEMVNPAPPSG